MIEYNRIPHTNLTKHILIINFCLIRHKQENIFILNEDQINEEQQRFINTYFSQEVGPSLVTLMLNNIQSISRIKDSNAFLAIRMALDAKKHPFLDPIQFALIEIPSSLKRFVVLPSVDGKTQLMLLDDLIRTQLSTIFDVFQHNSIEAHMVKFSRDAELDFDDDLSKSYIEKVAESVKVADQRAATPTQAAVLATPNRDDVLAGLDEYAERLHRRLEQRWTQAKQRVDYLAKSYALQKVQERLHISTMKVRNNRQSIEHYLSQRVQQNRTNFTNLKHRLERLNPNEALEKGYTRVWQDGQWIRHLEVLKPESVVEIEFKQGRKRFNPETS